MLRISGRPEMSDEPSAGPCGSHEGAAPGGADHQRSSDVLTLRSPLPTAAVVASLLERPPAATEVLQQLSALPHQLVGVREPGGLIRP